jgi:LL-diaminopimelate aminotransferase
MELAKRLAQIQEYYFSQKLREIDAMNKAGKQVINLGIGSPDLPPHPDVIQTLHEEALKPGQHAYQSYKGSPVLRNAIAAFYKEWYKTELDPEKEVLPLIGSKEGIVHTCMTYLNEGDQVLLPNPGYPTYRAAVHLTGAQCVDYELREANNWMPDFEALEQLVIAGNGRIRMMWVNYPHMPTGQLPTIDLFQQLIDFGRRHSILICHDNPYSFVLNQQPMSILSVPGAKDTAIELNSLSKSSNMAGWRVGMLVGSAERVTDILRFKSNMDSGMFLPLQLAAAKALALGKDWYDQLNTIYRERQQKVQEILKLLNGNFNPQQAGLFVWAKVHESDKDGYTLSDRVLKESNVFITPGGIFGTNGDLYVRISLCQPVHILEQAMQRIKEMK